MLHSKLKIIQARAEQTNKAALEAEKGRDEVHNQIHQNEEHLNQTEHALMMMLVMLMKSSQKLIIGT